MNYAQRNYCLAEMDAYSDPDAFVSDLSLSSIWNDPEESAEIPDERIAALARLWEVVHCSMRELLAPMTPTQASRRFCIPVRTLEDWYAGRRACPVYVRLLLAESLDHAADL